MICVKCKTENTRCVNDMLQVNYVAEIYKCDDCNGTIFVSYKNGVISNDNIMKYEYCDEPWF